MTTTQDTKTSDVTYTPVDGLLLEVEDLFVEFHTPDGIATAINGVTFDLRQGESLAILGESGSGKSVTAQAIMGILDMPPAVIPNGHIRYCGQDLLSMPDEQRRKTRGPEISMIFQDALSSLEPGVPRRVADRGDVPGAPRDQQERCPGEGHRPHGAGLDPGGARAGQGLSRTSSPAACASAS